MGISQINRLRQEDDWAAVQSILSFGVRIGIRTNRPELLHRLPDRFPPSWKPNAGSRIDRLFSLRVSEKKLRGRSGSYHELIEGQEAGVKARSLDEVLDAFEVRLKWYVAQMARRRVFVHAGVVGWNGQAIVIPGRSMSGKTSLVAELVRAGASYYSDEFAVLDLKGHVHPYPQRLEIRTDGSNRQEKYRIEDIGGIPGTKPVPVGLIAICQYRASARWRPARLSPGQAVLELLANTMPARRKPEVVIPTLRRAVSNVTILKGVRGEAGDVALNILKACEPRLSD